METYQEIMALVAAGYTIASIIIRLTPTVEDDKVFKKLAPWHEKALWLADKIFTASKHKK